MGIKETKERRNAWKDTGEERDRRKLTVTDQISQIFTDIKPGEGHTGLLMAANIMLILIAYYLIKPLREGWLSTEQLPGFTKMEIKAYSSYGQSLILIFVILAYDRMVTHLPRLKLIGHTTLFCIFNLVIFWFLQPNLFVKPIPGMGIIYYHWVGMFGVFMVAQTWTFVVDLYNDERGRRLLPMIAIGGTSGAVVGSWLVQLIIKIPFMGMESLLLVSCVPLFASWLLCRTVDIDARKTRRGTKAAPGVEQVVPSQGKAFDLVLRNHFLLGVAIITLFLNWINSNGENLLFKVINDVLDKDAIAQGITNPEMLREFIHQGITGFYGQFFFWVNVVALILQSVVASRLLKYGGFATIMLLLPLLVLTSSITMALLPVLSVIKVMKIAENATDYSINNTARHVLWLPMSLEVKFKAKTTIDSLFARLGDGLAAGTVLLGVNVFAFSLTEYFILNAVLVSVWLLSTILVVKEHRRLLVPT